MNAPFDDGGAIEPLHAHAAPRRAGVSASPEAQSFRIGVAAPNRPYGRRTTGQLVSALLKKSQGERLGLIGARNRIMAADDARNLLLERLGLIARIGAVRLHRLRGTPVIEWTITAAGLAALRDIRPPVFRADRSKHERRRDLDSPQPSVRARGEPRPQSLQGRDRGTSGDTSVDGYRSG